MAVFLQILGGACLLVGVAALGLILFLRWKVKSVFKEAVQHMAGITVPMTLDLARAEEEAWDDPVEASRIASQFTSAGFVSAGLYTSGRIPNLFLQGFVHEELRLYGGYFEMGEGLAWIDLVHVLDGDSTVTVTNTSQGGDTPSPPWSTKIVMPEAHFSELLAAMKARLSSDAPPVSPDLFAKTLAEFYEKSMAWQAEEGNINSPEDLMMAQAFTGVAPNPEDVAAAERIREEKEASIREAYLVAKGLSASEWERQRSRTLFIHDGLSNEDLADLLQEGMDIHFDGELFEEDYDVIMESELPARAALKDLMETSELQDILLLDLSLEAPHPCDVYVWDVSGTE
jgi:hypothetical protein